MFKRCLDSIILCQDNLDLIIISLNGKNTDEDLFSVNESMIDKNKLILLCTNDNYVAAKHGIWLCNKISEFVHVDDRLIFIAHDDEIIPNGFRQWVNKLKLFPKNIAWIGDYEVVSIKDADFHRVNKSVSASAYEKPISLIEWLDHNNRDPRRYVFTNISGLSVQFKVYQSYIDYQKRTYGNVGARSEFMLVSHRSVQGIMGVQNPYIRIHEHMGQEGRNIKKTDFLKDELRYTFWLFINSKNIHEFWWIFKSPWGIKCIFSVALSILSSLSSKQSFI